MEKKILFVDDDRDVLRIYKALALHRGYVPCCALSGDEALHIMANDHVRVFCVDLLMPGMDGFELCRRIKEIDPCTCVYAVSGYADGHNPEDFHNVGFDGFFGKPACWDMLFNAIRDAFEKITQLEQQNGDVCAGQASPAA